MMKITKAPKRMLEKLAQAAHMQIDTQTGLLFGQKDGFHITIYVLDRSFQTLVNLSVCQDGRSPDPALFQQFVQEHKELSNCSVSGYGVSFLIAPGATANSSTQKIVNTLPIITQFLAVQGFENCCESCGTRDFPAESYVLSGTPVWMCATCFQSHARSANAQPVKSENIIGGLAGALLGSLLGVIVMIIFGQLGYVSAISGLILAVCSIKGYELLGGVVSKKGIILSMLIVLVMTYLGNYLDWAVSAMPTLEIDFFTALHVIAPLIKEGFIDPAYFYGSLAMQYLFVLLGAVPTIRKALQNSQQTSITHKLSSCE